MLHPPTHPFHKHWPSVPGLGQTPGAWTWLRASLSAKILEPFEESANGCKPLYWVPEWDQQRSGGQKSETTKFCLRDLEKSPPGNKTWTRFCKKERGCAYWEEKSLTALLHENTQTAFRAGERSACVSCLERWQETDHNIGHPRIILFRQREPGIITFFTGERRDQTWVWEETFCWQWGYPCLIVTIF